MPSFGDISNKALKKEALSLKWKDANPVEESRDKVRKAHFGAVGSMDYLKSSWVSRPGSEVQSSGKVFFRN